MVESVFFLFMKWKFLMHYTGYSNTDDTDISPVEKEIFKTRMENRKSRTNYA